LPRGTPANTVAAFPTRDFTFVVDPPLLDSLVVDPRYSGAATLIHDLRVLEHGVHITLVFPAYLADAPDREPPQLLEESVYPVPTDTVPAFQLSKSVPGKVRHALESDDAEASRAVRLLALADAAHADGLVTEIAPLKEGRYPIYQHHRIRIIPLSEFGGVVEMCAHGHDVFWSSTEYTRGLGQDLYYHALHPKCRRLVEWFNRVSARLSPPEHHENVRSALLNRYPFVLYSRDMVRFYELQLDHFARRGLYRRFGGVLGYYITNFYLHLWGMLEQLTIMAKYQRDLTLEDAQCGIHKDKTFWKELGPKEPGLRKFVKSPPVAP
jgi:hypothetical protein